MSQTAIPKRQVLFLSDESGRWLWVSEGCQELLGYESFEFLGLKWHSFLHPDEHTTLLSEMGRCLQVKQPFRGRFRMLHQNGSWLEVVGHFERSQDALGKASVFVGSLDEAQLELETEALRQSKQIKANFLSTVNHELRTPLNGILGMVGLLLDTTLDDNQRDFARIIQTSAENLLSQIQNILDYSKADAGEMEIEPIAFDLRPALSELHESYLVPFAEKNLEFRYSIEGAVPKRVQGDPGRLRQILEILVENALRFTEKGHVLLCVNDAGRTANGWPRVEFAIQDTGIGIENHRIRHLIEPFTQAEPIMTRKVGGLGLGLAIAKRLLGMMRSRLRIESVPAEGSRFSFILEMQEAKPETPVQELAMAGRCILILDGHDVDRRVTGEHFIQLGCQVYESTTVSEAFRILSRNEDMPPVDLVIVDDDQLSESAESIGRRLANLAPTLAARWMALVTVGNKGDAHKLQMAGFRGFLVKPVQGDVLVEVARRVIAQKLDEPSLMITRHSLKELEEPNRAEDNTRGARILVVEDNIVNQKVLRHFLSKKGCSVDTAANGLEAVQLTDQFQYDMIFMDCRMPEMDGLEATRAIREKEKAMEKKAIPIVGLTAHALSHSYQECISAGMNGYLTKPFKRDVLWQEVVRWVSNTAVV